MACDIFVLHPIINFSSIILYQFIFLYRSVWLWLDCITCEHSLPIVHFHVLRMFSSENLHCLKTKER